MKIYQASGNSRLTEMQTLSKEDDLSKCIYFWIMVVFISNIFDWQVIIY